VGPAAGPGGIRAAVARTDGWAGPRLTRLSGKANRNTHVLCLHRVTHIGVGGGGGHGYGRGGEVRCNRTLDSPLGHYPSKG
jgi:hypothetical protein